MGATHQTIKLSRGRHKTADDGACVMELASMLAGEPFTDHPASVCPVIGALLRAYNDASDDERRQELYGYAAKVVDSRGSRGVECIREQRLAAWASELERRRFVRSTLAERVRRLAPKPPIDVIAARAIHELSDRRDRSRMEVLALVDELLAIGAPAPTTAAPTQAAPPQATPAQITPL